MQWLVISSDLKDWAKVAKFFLAYKLSIFELFLQWPWFLAQVPLVLNQTVDLNSFR